MVSTISSETEWWVIGKLIMQKMLLNQIDVLPPFAITGAVLYDVSPSEDWLEQVQWLVAFKYFWSTQLLQTLLHLFSVQIQPL